MQEHHDNELVTIRCGRPARLDGAWRGAFFQNNVSEPVARHLAARICAEEDFWIREDNPDREPKPTQPPRVAEKPPRPALHTVQMLVVWDSDLGKYVAKVAGLPLVYSGAGDSWLAAAAAAMAQAEAQKAGPDYAAMGREVRERMAGILIGLMAALGVTEGEEGPEPDPYTLAFANRCGELLAEIRWQYGQACTRAAQATAQVRDLLEQARQSQAEMADCRTVLDGLRGCLLALATPAQAAELKAATTPPAYLAAVMDLIAGLAPSGVAEHDKPPATLLAMLAPPAPASGPPATSGVAAPDSEECAGDDAPSQPPVGLLAMLAPQVGAPDVAVHDEPGGDVQDDDGGEGSPGRGDRPEGGPSDVPASEPSKGDGSVPGQNGVASPKRKQRPQRVV